MALNGRLLSLDRVFHGVLQDFPFIQEFSVPEAVEWCGTALDLIAVPYQYTEKVTDGNTELGHPCEIAIAKYRGQIPSDVISIIQIRDSDTGMPLMESSDSFHIGNQQWEANIPDTQLTLTSGTFQVTDENGDLVDSTFTSPLLESSRKLKDGSQERLTYKLNGCYIFTNFEEGSLIMSYKAFPTDCNGYPLYPDSVKYTEALKYFVAEKIAQKLWLQGKLDSEKFKYIQQQRDWYLGAATNSGLMPSVDQMEMWKQSFLRLIPNINAHVEGFKYQPDGEKRYTNSI